MARKVSQHRPPTAPPQRGSAAPSSPTTLTRAASNRGLATLFRMANADGGSCPKCEEKLHRRSAPGREPAVAPPIMHEVLRSPGQPLEVGIRADMEQRFGGADFSGVRIHTGAKAADSAAAVNARAYTVGADVVMGRGQSATAGSPLLAHELAHVEQQTGSAETAVAPMIQRDWLDDAISTAGDAYDTVAGGVKDTVSSIAQGVSDAVGSVSQVGSEAVTAVNGAANSVAGVFGLDAEKQRANLVGQVQAAEQRAGQIGPGAELTAEQVGPINAKIAAANVAAPFVIPLLAPAAEAAAAIGTFLAELAAVLLGAAAAEVLLVIIVVVAILALLYLLFEYFFKGPMPQVKPKPVTPPKTVEKPEAKPEPEPGPKPPPVPGPTNPIPSRPPCFPTGLTPDDPIPIIWFKPRSDLYYPRSILLEGIEYGRDDGPSTLPRGEPIGVQSQFWPFIGKLFQLIPEARGPGAARFRAVLARYGFDWAGLQADHVQDVEFEGPDDSGFINLWPMDGTANLSAGASTNNQTIRVCVGGRGDSFPTVGTLSQLKSSIYGRYFVIREIRFAPV